MKHILILILTWVFVIPIYSQQKKLSKKKIPPSVLKKQESQTATSSMPSKQETQDWIKEKIEGFSNSYNKPEYSSYGSHKYEVTYNNCSLTIKTIWKHNVPSLNGGRQEISVDFIYDIPLQSIASLNFIPIKTEYQIIFHVKSNDNLIKSIEIDKSTSPEKKEEKFESSVSLYISQESLKDNLPIRLTRAFDNLIKHCGGTVTKDVY